ncbi:MAG: amino acid adenylation domain-containing protein [Bacteroidales bacterium]|nr:amino acid adenylation domain-containing protein [Bacteroidales bacterium]
MNQTIYSHFQEHALQHPHRVAVLDEKRALTFGSLNKLIDTIIQRFPTERPRMVGVVMDHSVEMIASMLAVLKSGGAYVPIEPSFPRARMAFVFQECGVDFVITQRRHASKVKGFNTLLIEQGQEIDSSAPIMPDRSRPEGLAYVLYTSGSTGLPKGVMIENRNVVHYAQAFAHEFHPGPSDVMLQHSVCSFDIMVEEVYGSLLSGAALAIPKEATKKSWLRLLPFIERHGVTMVSGFPFLLLDLNTLVEKGKVKQLPPSLRLLISGGDVLRSRYISHLLPFVEIYNTYGPSETTVCASYQRCKPEDVLPDGTFPIGKPIQGVEVKILDSEGNEAAPDEKGEICISGDGVGRGYLGDRDIENEAFVTLDDGRRLYHSGDIGVKRQDGTLLFLHRDDKQVMILGRRVEAAEVENVLCQCPDVMTGLVTTGVDTGGLSYLVAYFVPKLKHLLSTDTLRRQMARFLPFYMIPEYFVSLDAIPLTSNGKPDLNALPKITKEATL